MHFIHQVEGKMSGDVTKGKDHVGSLRQSVIDSFRVGIDYVIRQCHFRHSFGLTPFDLSSTKLEAHQRSEMEQVFVRDLGADERAK